MRPFFQEVRDTQFATHPFIASLKSQLESMEPQLNASLPMGLLHGDLFLDNTLFDGDKMLAILDFEEGCYDTLLLDVGMTIIGCCYTPGTPIELKGCTEVSERLQRDASFDRKRMATFGLFRSLRCALNSVLAI